MCHNKPSETNKLVIWGASGHSLVVADIIRLCGNYQLVGLLDDRNLERKGELFNGLPVFGGREQLDPLLRQGVEHLIFGFGNCAARLELAELVVRKGFTFATAIHPRAVIAESARVGAGSVVAAGAIINPAAAVGDNVIINTHASIDHECLIGDGAHICPGVTLGGGVEVGRGAWVGIGASVKDHVRVGAGAEIGAGSVVVRDIPAGVLAYGVPARVMKEKQRD